MTPIRVLVVDDSKFMRDAMSRILVKDPGISIVGEAQDGHEALDKIAELKPDIVTLDINMPKMSGIEVLDRFSGNPPCPILVVSGFVKSDAKLSLIALSKGAYDFICKPSGERSADVHLLEDQIVAKIKDAMGSTPLSQVQPSADDYASLNNSPLDKRLRRGCVVGIGISTGGPNLLADLIPQFPKDFGAPILVAQHLPAHYTYELASRLNDQSEITVKEAEDGEKIQKSTVYIAPGGYHMRLSSTCCLLLEKELEQRVFVPSVDALFSSINAVCGRNALALVLTGMGSDGCKGAGQIFQRGGIVVAQTPETCAAPGMPQHVIDAGFADRVYDPKILVSKVSEWIFWSA